ncbi:LmeA family phospholipid-binding protein [Mycolicibacterium celeriflavum]|uniref:LmeA family phospholipid-binding protein n=1 Tax=Mycolicibacterium celeriflavum TaxID=1249101 RepID=UPI003CF1EDE7
MTDPWARPNQPSPQQGQVPPSEGLPPQGPPPGQTPPPGSNVPGPTGPGGPQGPNEPPRSESKLKGLLRDPLSLVLVIVIVVALVLAGLLGGELYARSRANDVVAGVTSCVVEDEASASFGVMPPFLIQHMSGHYTNIHVETAGNQIRDAKGMKVELTVEDVRLEDTPTSGGSVGSLVANISWPSEGIRQTISNSIPIIGSFVTGVTTNPSDGTIELKGSLGSIKARPTVADGGISLQVLELTGLGFTLPRETVQPALDAFTSQLTKNYPMGIKADSVKVTDDGVVSRFSTRNADIPKDRDDPCFAAL